MTINYTQLLRSTRRYTLIASAKLCYYAAQTFAFVACQLDDLNKYLTNIRERYES